MPQSTANGREVHLKKIFDYPQKKNGKKQPAELMGDTFHGEISGILLGLTVGKAAHISQQKSINIQEERVLTVCLTPQEMYLSGRPARFQIGNMS